MAKGDNLKGIREKTQFPHNDPTKGGRPVSIKNQLKDLLQSDGNITIPANQVLRVNDDGSVIMKVPTQMQLAMKLSSWAMSKKGNDSLKAIQMIMEQVDGKPRQEIDHNGSVEVKRQLVTLSDGTTLDLG